MKHARETGPFSQWFGAAAALLGVALATGCASQAEAGCDVVCDCQGGCTDNERAACESAAQQQAADAEAAGCAEQLDRSVDCFVSEVECVDGALDPSVCAAEQDAYLQCLVGSVEVPEDYARTCQAVCEANCSGIGGDCEETCKLGFQYDASQGCDDEAVIYRQCQIDRDDVCALAGCEESLNAYASCSTR